jgi:hypothetical protein
MNKAKGRRALFYSSTLSISLQRSNAGVTKINTAGKKQISEDQFGHSIKYKYNDTIPNDTTRQAANSFNNFFIFLFLLLYEKLFNNQRFNRSNMSN